MLRWGYWKDELTILVKTIVLIFISFAWQHIALAGAAQSQEQHNVLKGGWDVFPPYAYRQNENGISRWSGLDVELMHEYSKRAGYYVSSKYVHWKEHVEGLQNGEFDIISHAGKSSDREKFAYFSVPYRPQTLSFLMRKSIRKQAYSEGVEELVQRIRDHSLRVGVIKGSIVANAQVSALLDDPDFQNNIRYLAIDDVLPNLIHGEIDGIFVDEIWAANAVTDLSASNLIVEHPVTSQGNLHLMFSKKTVTADTVARFNEAIKTVYEDGTYRQLNAKYAAPILVKMTLDTAWFTVVDLLGTAAFAISGLLLAYRYNFDIFGALVLASLPAIGGGVVRDLITTRNEIAALSSPIYILIVIALVIGGFVLLRMIRYFRKKGIGAATAEQITAQRERIMYVIQVCDAIGLAAFTVTGVVVALITQSAPLWLWGPILAAMTAAGGGILRDVVRSEPEIPALKGEFYPEIALLWGLFLSLFFSWEARELNVSDIRIGILVTFLGAFLTRMATIHLGLKSPRFST